MWERKSRRRLKLFKYSTIIIIGILVLVGLLFKINSNYKKSLALAAENERVTSITYERGDIYERLKSKGYLNILVVGDSIGLGGGVDDANDRWFNLIRQSIKDKYGSVVFIDNKSVGGATVLSGYTDYLKDGNTYRYKDEYDAVFVCFGQNDKSTVQPEVFAKMYERLIRQIKIDKGNPEIFGIIESSIRDEKLPDEIMKLSKYYNFPVIDTKKVFAESAKEYESLTKDGIHPNKAGYVLYKNEIMNVIDNGVNSGRKVTKMDQISYMNESAAYADLRQINTFDTNKGFKFDEETNSFSSNIPGSYIESKFKGKVLGISLKRGSKGGIANIYVDGIKVKEYDLYSTATTPYKYVYLVSDELLDSEHNLRVEISDKKNDKSANQEVILVNVISN